MKRNIDYPLDLIRQLISEGWTQQKIAEKLAEEVDHRITPKLIYKVCKKHSIRCQRNGPRAGSGHPNWKGGIHMNRSGYREVYSPNHPVVAERNRRGKAAASGYFHPDNYYEEHRLVAEHKLGRILNPSEVVHHIDGNKLNNSPDNLEVFCSNKEHLAATLSDKCPRWSEAGKAAIQRAVERVAHTRRTMREHGVPLSPQTKTRQIAQLLENGLSPSQTADLLGLEQAESRSRQKQCADRGSA